MLIMSFSGRRSKAWSAFVCPSEHVRSLHQGERKKDARDSIMIAGQCINTGCTPYQAPLFNYPQASNALEPTHIPGRDARFLVAGALVQLLANA